MRRVLLAVLISSLVVPAAGQAHRVSLAAPAQFDVAVAQLRFAVPHGPRPALRLALAGPTGLDYVAIALPRDQPRHAVIALVAVVNRRPQGSQAPDPAHVVLTARPSRAVRAPTVTQATNVLATTPASAPAACALGALTVSDLRFALRAGAPPAGFGVRSTIAQALNAACGRPVDAAFRTAVGPPALPAPSPKPTPCPPCPPLPTGQPRIVCPVPRPAICPTQA